MNINPKAIINRRKRDSYKELDLQLTKYQLFDTMVLGPHNELNEHIYAAVERFAERDDTGKELTINIYTEKTPSVIREKFEELFWEHYEDEIRIDGKYLNQHYFLAGILAIVSFFCILIWIYLFRGSQANPFLVALANIGVFCLWETQTVGIEVIRMRSRYRMLHRIRDAHIHFYEIKRESNA